jgi:hypothetical protein
MHFDLSRINILEQLSTAVLICNGFIPRRPDGLRAATNGPDGLIAGSF